MDLFFFFFYRKGKADTPKTPTTPTSPMSPGFSSAGGPLSPHLATGDSIRDKCIEMLAAALRTDSEAEITLCHKELNPQVWSPKSTFYLNATHKTHVNAAVVCTLTWKKRYNFFVLDDFKEFGTNCESMAAEIEDYILWIICSTLFNY